MSKFIIKMPDGSVWEADSQHIAESRANYYVCEVDGLPREGAEWVAEVMYAMTDASVLSDWAQNNMDWADLEAKLVTPPKTPDYSEMFAEAEFSVS